VLYNMSLRHLQMESGSPVPPDWKHYIADRVEELLS